MRISAALINFKLASVRIHLVVLVWTGGDRCFLLAHLALAAARMQQFDATTELRDITQRSTGTVNYCYRIPSSPSAGEGKSNGGTRCPLIMFRLAKEESKTDKRTYICSRRFK
jgi:hypothetical protein